MLSKFYRVSVFLFRSVPSVFLFRIYLGLPPRLRVRVYVFRRFCFVLSSDAASTFCFCFLLSSVVDDSSQIFFRFWAFSFFFSFSFSFFSDSRPLFFSFLFVHSAVLAFFLFSYNKRSKVNNNYNITGL